MVLFVRSDGNSDWHGRFRETGRGMAFLDFHHDGDEELLKHAVLVRTDDGWRGFDAANRMVMMNELWRIYWGVDSTTWKPIRECSARYVK